MNPVTASPRLHLALLAAWGVLFVLTGWAPKDRLTWALEAAPAVVALAILAALYGRWRLTPLVLWLVLAHCAILMIGARYTYAEVPWFNWLRDEFGLARNYYDRLGHFAQGFVPALVAREILLRNRVLPRGPWLFFLVAATCLAISATYEFVEWWVALASGEAAEAFLGTQGDPWDTQWDMFLALCGATLAQALLGRVHDRQLGLGGPAPAVSLRAIDEANIDEVAALRVAKSQERLVASVGKTFWQACGRDDVECRAVYAGGTPAGFVATVVKPEAREPGGHHLYLARLLVDERHQGRGIGSRALDQVIAEARARGGCTGMRLSFVPANARAAAFYESRGFRRTGVVDEEGEHEMWLAFGNSGAAAQSNDAPP
ncbi:MAG: GNAT family N-acetyltransferase [Burkholderiales bacterium]